MAQYINNKDFEILIRNYKQDPIKYEDEFIRVIDLLITNIIYSFSFKVDTEDAKQDCFVLVLKTINNFNKEEGTAFNFFTTIIVNNLKAIYTKKKKYNLHLQNYASYIDPDKLV